MENLVWELEKREGGFESALGSIIKEYSFDFSKEALKIIEWIFKNYLKEGILNEREVKEIYKYGLYSYLYDSYFCSNINGSGYYSPERVTYWYITKDGLIGEFTISARAVGLNSVWDKDVIKETLKKIKKAMKNAYPLSYKALENALQEWERRLAEVEEEEEEG